MDDNQDILKAEDQLALTDPQAYLVSNPTPRDWNLSTQDIARSIKIEDPRQFLGLTQEDLQGPKKLNILETIGQGIWDTFTENPIRESNETRMFYSSPNMNAQEAERLMNDVLYTDYKRREAQTIKSADEIKYNKLYGFSNGVGSAIKYALLGLTGGPVAGTTAVGALAGVEAAAQVETDLADRYIDNYGKTYTKGEMWKDTGLATGYGAFAGLTEAALGIERVAAGALGRYSKLDALSRLYRMQGKKYASGALKALGRGGMSGVEEGFEELVQNPAEDATIALAGYAEDLTSDEVFNKAFTSALYGAIIGGTMGWGLYRVNRKSIIDKIAKWNAEKNAGLNDIQIVEMADQMLDDGKTKMLDEVATRVEIRNKYGEAYDLVKKRLMDQINATETVPWQDKAKTKEEYVEALADAITFPAINSANILGIPLHDFLEIADVESWVVGNIIGFKPITSIADIDEIIAKQDAIIKDQREKKKLGIGNDQVLDDAKQRKAIAQRVRREVAVDQEIAKRRSNARKATSDYITAQELQPANVVSLSNATVAEEGQDYVLVAGKKIPVEYQVVELSEVQPSHINGTVNPNYTNEQLQNRASRGTVQDVADLREKASTESFTPERLMKSPTSAEGAPIVNAKGEVIAGNGRAEIVRYAYENPETADKYKQSLVNAGFNIEGMNQPILIRRNTTLTPDEQIATADISNISETSAFDEASQARRDSKYLAGSKDATEFASKLPMSERRGLMQNNGKWNKRRVQQRYESALLSWLCGNDTQLFEKLVLDRGISQKVIDVLTANGAAIYETATKYPDLNIREDIYHALVKMQATTKDNFLQMTQQLSIDGHDVMPENMFVWNWLFADSTSNRNFMDYYLSTLAKNQEEIAAGQDMFGDKKSPLSKKDALIQALKKADQAKSEMAASRGKNYEPLFNENGVTNDPVLLSAIASYKNQFAPTSQLNQRVIVSMKGEIEGEYLDADKYLGLGEGSRVWLWGNYTLLDEQLDRRHYFERFDSIGPEPTYNGKKLNDKYFAELGIDGGFWNGARMQGLIRNYAGRIGTTKEELVEKAKNILSAEEKTYRDHVNKVVAKFAKTLGRPKTRQIIKDIEEIITVKGTEMGPAVRFPEGSKEAEIQNKYRKEDGSLDQDFVDVYTALVKAFDYKDSITAYLNGFIGAYHDLIRTRAAFQALKKLDWNKFGGRTGFLVNGKDFQTELSLLMRSARLFEHDRNQVYALVDDTIRDALIHNKDVDTALKDAEEPMLRVLELVPSVDKAVEENLEKFKSEFPKADTKAIAEYLHKYMTTPQNDTRGWSPSVLMSAPTSFSQEDLDLLKKVARADDHGISIQKWDMDVPPTLADVIYKITSARTQQNLLHLAQTAFKNATFEYKPRASMYAAEAPENEELLNASRQLDKQPRQVQQAIINMIREYGNKFPQLGLLNNLINPIVAKSKIYDSETGQELLRAFGFPFYDSIGTMAKDLRNNTLPEEVKNEYGNLDVEERIWAYMGYAVERAYQKNPDPTIKDLIDGLEAQYRHYADSPYNNSFKPYRDMHNGIVDFLRKGLAKQEPDTKLSDFFGKVELGLTKRNAFTFLSDIVGKLKLFPEVRNQLAEDKSLELTDNPPADEITIKMLRKFGVKGLRYYGRRDKHGIVTWQRTPVTERLLSQDLSNRLVVTHGISIDKLNQALDLGGLPVPSIAISRADKPLTDFGPIKLVGTKNMIDPSDPTNRVYDRDIWSTTFPTAEYKNATITQARAFREKFGKWFAKTNTEANLNDLLYYATNSKRAYQAIDKFKYSDGAQLYYIENVLGKKFTIPMQNDRLIRLENVMPFVKPDQQFIDEVSKIDKNIDNSNVLRKALEKPLRDLIARSPASEAEKQHARNYFFGENKEGLFNFSNNSVFHLASAVREYAAEPEKMSVDDLALFKELQKYDLANNSAYLEWADKQMKDLLGEPRVKVGNRLLPWTKENITKAMIRHPIIGSEQIGTGVGKVIASGARRFGSIEDIRQGGQSLNTKEASDAITDKVGEKISAFASQIIKQGYSEFEREPIYDALIKVALMKNPTTEALQSALSAQLQDSTKFDQALLEEGIQIIQEVKGLSRYYFEAKPQRTVGFNEFVGAIVPTNKAFDESADKLTQQGLNVIRSDDVQEGIASLALQNEDILFQNRKNLIRGSYDPELQTIILNKNWNELTLVHEFHHRYLELIWGFFKQAQLGSRQVPQAWLEDVEQLFRMLEIDPAQDQLTTVQQEKFTYMVEAYLTGLGVDNVDNLAFQGFLHWVPEQYRSIMDLGYLDENNIVQNPMLDEESIAWFNKWFASPFAPSLPSAPDAQRMINATDNDGEIVPSDQKTMNNREKEWGQDSEEQLKADAQLRRAIDENMPSDMRAALDGEKEIMKVEGNNLPDDTKLPEEQKPTFRERWFKAREKNARERAADMARKYLAENPEKARELAFADPEISVEYDAPVDRGMLIRAVMETVPQGSQEWYILNDNLAMVKSMSGSTLALSGDLSHQAYLDAKREIEAARELKAAVNYAGTGRGAMEKWNGDIKAFIAKRAEAILALEPDSEERQTAIKAMLEEAKTKFSGNTTNAVLNQLDLTGMRTKNSQVFIKWAEKQIKQGAHAKIDAAEQKELMKASIAAQLALRDIDSTEQKDGKFVRAVQSGKDINHWQFVKDKMKKAYVGRWGKFGIFMDNLFGSYAPSAMLMSANTLFFANVPSTAVNTATTRLAVLAIGKNAVDNQIQKDEIHRIKQVFNATGMNLAQMDKPTSPSTLHGEKYTATEQKHWYNFTFEILGRTDNEFRVPTFVDALARIATKNANGDKARANALFKEYCRLNTTSDEAKIARKQALAIANMAVFTQDGIMASALNHIRSALNSISRGALGLQPNGFGLGNILAPFLKTGANITEMGISSMLALPRTVIAGLQKLQGKEIPDIKKIALLSDWINLAWMSVVLAVLAAINSDDEDWYIEPYQPGQSYDPNKPYDSVNFGGVWIKLDVFGPMAIPLRASLKMVNDWEKKKLDAVANGLFFGGMEALSDTPLVQQFTDSSLDYMTSKPGAYWSGFGYNQANKLIPAQLKTLSRAISRGANVEMNTDWMGKTISRKFHRNYGLDGQRLTTNDLINVLTNRLKYNPQ